MCLNYLNFLSTRMLLISANLDCLQFCFFSSLPVTGTDAKFTDQVGGLTPRIFFCSSMPIY